MKKLLSHTLCACILTCGLTACGESAGSQAPYQLTKEDIRIEVPQGGFTVQVDQLLRINVQSLSDENVNYRWTLNGETISTNKNLEHMFTSPGTYELTLTVTQGDISFSYTFTVNVISDEEEPDKPEGITAYITQVLDYVPAPGQFVNLMPQYEEGDTQESMNRKVLEAIGYNNKGTISLGGFGGYVTLGFDHTIENREGLCDFRVLGNAHNGNSEPGVIQVAYDANRNGHPDEDEWYEIAGSAHRNPEGEAWIEQARKAGNNVNLYKGYAITYYRPDSEPEGFTEQYIYWEDNKGHKGYKAKNTYHAQSYFPQWIETQSMTFQGTCLPQNAIDGSGNGSYFVLHRFDYGYADNYTNAEEGTAIDIDWAITEEGNAANLPGADFIRIYTGINQENGWIGECSTEISGVEDLHMTGEEIVSAK